MKFCMITTFYGANSFGGDAAFVDRLSRALARRGHEVHVVHCRDAFEIVRGGQTPRPHQAAPGVIVHELSSPFGALSPLATQQTGQPFFKRRAIEKIVEDVRPDVVHFHNLSLIGGPGLLNLHAPEAVKLWTTHEHWLVCPSHVLWKNDVEICESKSCVRCCLQSRRPPQLWRLSGLMERSLKHLDALICPSRSTQKEHARRGVATPTVRLPYFLPDDYTGLPERPEPAHDRPYVAAAGRLEKIKGFQDAIEAIRELPWLDLRIAGAGRFEKELRTLAEGLKNVHFEGRLDSADVAALFRGSRAVVVPSLVYETFGYVVVEAFQESAPVIVRNLGALPELIAESNGGLTFDSRETLVAALRRIGKDDALRDELGENGRKARREIWSEENHLARYFEVIDSRRALKGFVASVSKPNRSKTNNGRSSKIGAAIRLARSGNS